MPRLLASLPVTELACAALVALTDLVRAWAPPSGMLPPSSPWPCSLPWLLNVPRRHRGHLRTYLLSAHVSLPRAHPPGLPGCLLRAATGPPTWSQGSRSGTTLNSPVACTSAGLNGPRDEGRCLGHRRPREGGAWRAGAAQIGYSGSDALAPDLLPAPVAEGDCRITRIKAGCHTTSRGL